MPKQKGIPLKVDPETKKRIEETLKNWTPPPPPPPECKVCGAVLKKVHEKEAAATSDEVVEGVCYRCSACRNRVRLAALNLEAAKAMQMPESCFGCVYCQLLYRRDSLQNQFTIYGPGPDNYGRNRLFSEPKYWTCTLYERELAQTKETPRPLTRFCFTWPRE
jgi:hypothetical protein